MNEPNPGWERRLGVWLAGRWPFRCRCGWVEVRTLAGERWPYYLCPCDTDNTQRFAAWCAEGGVTEVLRR